jgi:hypothetical protein
MSQRDIDGPTGQDLRAKVFRDREHTRDWRVEKMDDDGGIEVALFSGSDARQRAISYADRMYGEFDEIFSVSDPEKSAEGSADSIFDLVLALVGSAIRTFPTSRFAEQYRGKTL